MQLEKLVSGKSLLGKFLSEKFVVGEVSVWGRWWLGKLVVWEGTVGEVCI